jgi:organic radical activating enzyme
MTFVRFSGCSLSCRWCDTNASLSSQQYFRVETPPTSGKFINHNNPVDLTGLNGLLAYFTDTTVSVTGGEPLEQVDFLSEWLPTLKPAKRVLLETNGIYASALERVARHVDVISMDIKLPSSTGRKALWKDHKDFLSAAMRSGKETYIKVVITKDTTSKDIQETINIVSSVNKFVPVILQPVSATEDFGNRVSDDQVQSFARLCNLWLPNVSIMRQLHKELGIL